MLRMPVIHTPPPTCPPVSWQQGTASLDNFELVDSTASKTCMRNEGQPSGNRTLSPLIGFTYMLLFASFLALSGCKKFDELIGARKAETSSTSSVRALPDDTLFIGTSRAVWLKPNRTLPKKLHDQLKAQAYREARKLIDKDVREKVKAAYPNDCHFGNFTFEYDIAWNYFSYDMETVRTRKNGWRLVRVLCKTTWRLGWCKQRYTGDRSMNISGSRIPYSTPNPALKGM